jgi:hypothetical protein
MEGSTIVQSQSPKRFVIIGGPRGELSCRPVGCPMLADRYRRWQRLATVNRPLSPALADAGKAWALRAFVLA